MNLQGVVVEAEACNAQLCTVLGCLSGSGYCEQASQAVQMIGLRPATEHAPPAFAVSAGTNLMLVPSTSTHLAQLGALSPNGRSTTFEAAADGYGRGEACIVFVARRPTGQHAPLAVLHGELHLGIGPAVVKFARILCCGAQVYPDLLGFPPCPQVRR